MQGTVSQDLELGLSVAGTIRLGLNKIFRSLPFSTKDLSYRPEQEFTAPLLTIDCWLNIVLSSLVFSFPLRRRVLYKANECSALNSWHNTYY